jgi:hypothetical protein
MTIDDNAILVQAIIVGASDAVCRQCGAGKFIQDLRGYGLALRQEGYPLLSQWVRCDWDDAGKAECLRMIQTAVDHGSLPMLLVAAIPLKSNPVLRQQFTQTLNDKQQAKLKQLLACGEIVDPKHEFLEPWRLSL